MPWGGPAFFDLFTSDSLGLLPGLSRWRRRDRADLLADVGEHHAAVRHFLLGQAVLRASGSLGRSRDRRRCSKRDRARVLHKAVTVTIAVPVPAVIAIAPVVEAPGVVTPRRVRPRKVAGEAREYGLVHPEER